MSDSTDPLDPLKNLIITQIGITDCIGFFPGDEQPPGTKNWEIHTDKLLLNGSEPTEEPPQNVKDIATAFHALVNAVNEHNERVSADVQTEPKGENHGT